MYFRYGFALLPLHGRRGDTEEGQRRAAGHALTCVAVADIELVDERGNGDGVAV